MCWQHYQDDGDDDEASVGSQICSRSALYKIDFLAQQVTAKLRPLMIRELSWIMRNQSMT